MNESIHADVHVYVCHQCVSSHRLSRRQWMQKDLRVHVTELPCGGKTDTQYLFHALEAGAQGLLVVTCPHGECRLAQGNYRAEVRVRTVERLLSEVGVEPERAVLVSCAREEDLESLIRGSVERFRALGQNPILNHEPGLHNRDGAASLQEGVSPVTL